MKKVCDHKLDSDGKNVDVSAAITRTHIEVVSTIFNRNFSCMSKNTTATAIQNHGADKTNGVSIRNKYTYDW